MFARLPESVRGVLSMLLFVLNLVFWIIPFYVIALVKLLPVTSLHVRCLRGLEGVAARWIDGNNAIAALHGIEFDVRGAEGLRMDDWYLLSSNHQSWCDVFALQYAFNRRIPFLRFFIKKQLIWVPLLGLAWWAIELPFLHRHSREMLQKHPELRKQDLESTRRACEPCRHRPTTIISFLEGTRFTPAKHDAQSSPFRYLLKPKVGGLAFALSALGEVMNNFLDVTIVYSRRGATFWDLMCGRISRIVIDIERHTIPKELFGGDYTNDAAYRERFKDWVYALWEHKDRRYAEIAATL